MRNTNIEVLRLVLMLVILCWHILVHGYDFKDIGIANMECLSDEVAIVLTSLFAPATYCFMFISGYYGLKFSVKKGISLELWLILASLLTFLISSYFFGKFSILELIKACFPVSTGKWWFMTSYIVLFILSPILNKGINCLSKNSFLLIIVLLVSYQTFSFLCLKNDGGSNFLGLLTIFLMGRYFSIYKIEIKKQTAQCVFVLCWVFLIGLMLLANHYSKKYVFTLLNYNTPLIMAMAITVFYNVKGMVQHYSSRINTFLKPVLFIYLITEGLYVPFYEWVTSVLKNDMLMGGALFIIIPLACLIIGHIFSKFVDFLVLKIICKSTLCKRLEADWVN